LRGIRKKKHFSYTIIVKSAGGAPQRVCGVVHLISADVCFLSDCLGVVGEGFLRHRPSDGAIVIRNRRPHALHRNVRCLGRVCAHAIDNQGEGNANDRGRHVEEDIEAVRLGGVGRDDEDHRNRVDRAGLGDDPRFLREADRLACIAHSALARPETIGDEQCAEAIYGSGRAEERLCDLLLLLDEDRVTFGELSKALNGRDAGTDIGEEDQERQQDDEEVVVPNDEASVKDEGVEEDGGDQVERGLDQAQRRGDVEVVDVGTSGLCVALKGIYQSDGIGEDMPCDEDAESTCEREQ